MTIDHFNDHPPLKIQAALQHVPAFFSNYCGAVYSSRKALAKNILLSSPQIPGV